jgi:hypothetical protein
MKIEPAVRYTKPCKCDVAEFGTIVLVKYDDAKEELFVQLGADTIDWHPIGYLLEKTFSATVLDKDFFESCLKAFRTHECIKLK